MYAARLYPPILCFGKPKHLKQTVTSQDGTYGEVFLRSSDFFLTHLIEQLPVGVNSKQL